MRYKTIFLLTFVVALAAATALIAQDSTSTTGKVTSVDASAGTITVTTAAGSTETFSTDAQSMYMANGRTVTLSTVKTGDQVTVTYRDDNGTKTATHVDVVPTGSTTTTGDAYNPKTPTDTYNSNPGGTVYTPPADTATDRDTPAYHDEAMNTRTDNHLPKTASPLPLIGLAAALCGGAALGIAGMRRLAS